MSGVSGPPSLSGGSARSRGRRHLLRQSALTSAAAAAAVFAGLLLDVAVAVRFGANRATDAYFVASRLPVGLAGVVLGGPNLVLVPLFSRWAVTRTAEQAREATTALLVIVTVGCTAVAIPVGLLAPLVVRVLAPGINADTATLSAHLLRIMIAVIPLTAMAELLRSLLNARRSFVVPAAMNIVLNGVAATVIVLGPRNIQVAAYAYLIGSIYRVLFLLVMARRLGIRFRLRRGSLRLRNPDIRQGLRLSFLPAASAGFAPLARSVEQAFASFLPAGSISLLNYGYRLVFAIGGAVFFRSIVGILAPRLAEAHARGDFARVRRLTGTGVRVMTLVSVPLVALFGTLSVPGALVVFRRGNFDRASALLLGALLSLLGICLVGEALQRILLAPFFAALDTRTPFRNALYGTLAEFLLLPLLVLPFGRGRTALYGIVIAYVLSEYVGPVHAWWRLRASIGTPAVDLPDALWRAALPAAFGAVIGFSLRAALDLDAPHSRGEALALVALSAVSVGAGMLAGLLITEGKRLSGLALSVREEGDS